MVLKTQVPKIVHSDSKNKNTHHFKIDTLLAPLGAIKSKRS